MELWPAIDLRGGRCVRLLQGDYARETVFGDDPVVMARRFVAAGARRLHIVDLDGARDGGPTQAALVARMVQAAGVPCQVGGGIRTLEAARDYLAAGLARVIIGSVAIERPDLLDTLAETFPQRVVLGLDARGGKVAVRGWVDTSPLTAIAYFRIGPTPWVSTSQPAAVSSGEPQLPIWTYSQGSVGFITSCLACQKWSMSDSM